MTNGNGNQDDELELIRQLLIATANRAESTDAKLDRLVESQDRTQRQLDQLAVKQDRTQDQLDQLSGKVDQLRLPDARRSLRVRATSYKFEGAMNQKSLLPPPPEHQQMIQIIMGLPEFPVIVLWTDKQKQYLEGKQNFWQWCGLRIDYLQMVQCGFLPEDPKEWLSDRALKEWLQIYTDYLFGILQVVINGFAIIKQAALRAGLDFRFKNPRELFTEICKDFSSVQVAEATDKGVGVGSTLNETRDQQGVMNKLYRGTLSKEDRKAILEFLESSVAYSTWGAFWLYAILRDAEPRYLKNWDSWEKLSKAHKALYQFLKKDKSVNVPQVEFRIPRLVSNRYPCSNFTRFLTFLYVWIEFLIGLFSVRDRVIKTVFL